MADLPTRQELFERFRDGVVTTPNTRISPSQVDREGSDINLIANAAAVMGEEVVRRLAQAVACNFEDTAEGDGLERVIFDRKGLPKLPAAPAVGSVQLTRLTAGAGAGTIDGGLPGETPAPTRIRTNRGIVYLLTQDAIFGVADLGPITVPVQAELAGLDNEVGANQSWSFLDLPFDTTIQIVNPTAMAGAADEETDADYRARAKAFFPTVRRGTIGAVEFGLRSVSGIASVTVIESIAAETGLPALHLSAFILDALGQSNQTLGARGLLNLLEFRAGGIPVVAVPGTPTFIDVELFGTSFDTSIVLDTSQAAHDVRAAIVAALNNQRPGQNLLRSTILAAARSVPGFVVEDTDLVEPAGTLIPSSLDVAFRTRRELIQIA